MPQGLKRPNFGKNHTYTHSTNPTINTFTLISKLFYIDTFSIAYMNNSDTLEQYEKEPTVIDKFFSKLPQPSRNFNGLTLSELFWTIFGTANGFYILENNLFGLSYTTLFWGALTLAIIVSIIDQTL